MSRHRRAPENPGRHRALTGPARHATAGLTRRRSGPTGGLAAIPMIGLLVTLSLMPGMTPTGRGPSPTARLNAPAVAVHPPTRGCKDQLPGLIPTLRAATDTDAPTSTPTPTPTAAQTATPTASAPVPDDRTLAAAATHRTASAGFILTASEQRIPARMLTAYRAAAVRMATEHPSCHLSWQLLAGIGRIESGHAAGHALTPDGTLTRPILGPPLDGHDGRALIRDTDRGALDHDTRYDRAVGPMQFIPTTWASAGRDNSGDGRADPDNVDDAALAAAGYLCQHGHDLADPAQLHAAIYKATTPRPATSTPSSPGPPGTPPATPRPTPHVAAPRTRTSGTGTIAARAPSHHRPDGQISAHRHGHAADLRRQHHSGRIRRRCVRRSHCPAGRLAARRLPHLGRHHVGRPVHPTRPLSRPRPPRFSVRTPK